MWRSKTRWNHALNAKSSKKQNRATKMTKPPSRRRTAVEVNFCKPFLQGRYAFVTDQYSRYPEVVFTATISFEGTKTKLKKILTTHGVPQHFKLKTAHRLTTRIKRLCRKIRIPAHTNNSTPRSRSIWCRFENRKSARFFTFLVYYFVKDVNKRCKTNWKKISDGSVQSWLQNYSKGLTTVIVSYAAKY